MPGTPSAKYELPTLAGSDVISGTDEYSVALTTALDQAIGVDVGDVKMTARSSAPSGWLLCDGSAVNRTTYAALFSAIGTAYGAGNGTTTFNLPDYRGRSPLGAGTGSGLTARTLGATAGSEPSNMPSHSHGIGSNSFDRPAINTAGSGGNIGTGSVVAVLLNTASAGGGADNMHPVQVCNFVIRT